MDFEEFVIMGRGKMPESYMAIAFPKFLNYFSASLQLLSFVSFLFPGINISLPPLSHRFSLSSYPVFSFIPLYLLYPLLLPSYRYVILFCE